jgi:hypothetical protein
MIAAQNVLIFLMKLSNQTNYFRDALLAIIYLNLISPKKISMIHIKNNVREINNVIFQSARMIYNFSQVGVTLSYKIELLTLCLEIKKKIIIWNLLL